MKALGWSVLHLSRDTLRFCGTIAAVVVALVILKRRFKSKAQAWPTIPAKIENVFVDVSSGRHTETHVVLAYEYSIGGSYYSGQIMLEDSEAGFDSVQEELVGKEVVVHYDPGKPETSIYLEGEIDLEGAGLYLVVADSRISFWSWLWSLVSKLP